MTKKEKAVLIYLLLLPIIDVITSLMTRFGDFNLSLGMIVKGLTIVFSVIYIFFFSKSKWRRKSIVYFFVLAFFFLMYILFKNEIWQTSSYLTEITFAFRYFYFVVILLGVANIFDDCEIDNKLIRKVFFISSLIYAGLMLVPLITNTSFSSYEATEFGGDNGWFYAANETGAITTLLLLGTMCLFDNKNKPLILIFIPILLSIVFIGTKVSYLGMILATIAIIIFYLIKNKKQGIILSVMLGVILVWTCTYSPALANLEGNSQRIENERRSKVADKKLDQYIHNKNIAKLVELALNGREEFFLNDMLLYIDEDPADKLFGLGWTMCQEDSCDYENMIVEIDYFDVFFHYGIVGFIVYFIPLLYIAIDFFKSKKTKETYYYLVFLLLGLMISSIAGHVLSAPAVSIYLILIIYMMYQSYEFKINDKEVTILALHLGHGGVEKYISSLCKMLPKDFKINVISTYKLYPKPVYDFAKDINITYLIDGGPNKEEFKQAIKDKKFISIIKEGFKSLRILYLRRRKNIKAIRNIHSKYIITTRILHNKLVCEYANKNIIKIATEHNYHNDNKKYYHKVINSIYDFDYFVLVSEPLLKFYQDKVKHAKCIYIPNTIDYLPKKGTCLNENVLVNVGRLEPEKGLSDLIDIIDLVKDRQKDIKLYLIGDGSLRSELETKVKEKKLTKYITFTGYGDREVLEKYLSKAKLYVMTSHTESFGIVLLEAMSYKVPCIAFDSANGAKELLKNNTGILISNRDKEAMADKITKLLNSQKELKAYSEKGYEKAKTFLITNVEKQWLKIIK